MNWYPKKDLNTCKIRILTPILCTLCILAGSSLLASCNTGNADPSTTASLMAPSTTVTATASQTARDVPANATAAPTPTTTQPNTTWSNATKATMKAKAKATAKTTATTKRSVGRTIYITKTGKRYHYNNHCNAGTYYSSTLGEAVSRGLTPCQKCVV